MIEIVESKNTKPLLTRFWDQIVKTDSCWEWKGVKRNGYGTIKVAGRSTYAHRLSWMIHNGIIDDRICVLHKCDNPKCVNPEHLFLGTRKDNAIDCATKGRNVAQKRPEIRRGENGSMARLTEDKVREIRLKYSRGKVTYALLANEYGMEKSTIGKIVQHKLWSHV